MIPTGDDAARAVAPAPSVRTDDAVSPTPVVGETAPLTAAPDVPEPTLGALVTALTRRASDEVLAALVVGGIVVSASVAILAPTWWRLVPPFLLLASAGGWGIADAERRDRETRGRVAGVVRALAVLTGLVAAAGGMFAFMGLALGRWIS
jgi:hypothetical protein